MFRRKHHDVHSMDKIHTPEEEQQKVMSEMKCMKILSNYFFQELLISGQFTVHLLCACELIFMVHLKSIRKTLENTLFVDIFHE